MSFLKFISLYFPLNELYKMYHLFLIFNQFGSNICFTFQPSLSVRVAHTIASTFFGVETVSQLCKTIVATYLTQIQVVSFQSISSRCIHSLVPLREIMRHEDKRQYSNIQDVDFENYVEATHIIFEGDFLS